MRRPRPRRPAWALIPALVAMTGTALGQPVRPKPPAPRPAPAPTPTPTPAAPPPAVEIDDPMLAPPAAPATELASWDAARRLLATSSTDLRRADAAVARAEAAVTQARSAILPRASAVAVGEIDLLHPDTAPSIPPGADYEPTSPLGTATISATQSLIDVGAWRGLSAARADRKAATLGRADEDRRITRDLARAMLAVSAAMRATELNRLGLRQALERAQITKRTFQLGAATDPDVVRIEQDVPVARAAL